MLTTKRHPYLLLQPDRLQRIRKGLGKDGKAKARGREVKTDPTIVKWVGKMRKRMDKRVLPAPLLTPDWVYPDDAVTAPILLYTARAAVSRISILSLLWHIYKDDEPGSDDNQAAIHWLNRARQELLSIAAFPGWQEPTLPPEVFLSVAEMTTAAAIGLDWLWDQLNAEERCKVQQAIVRNALEPSKGQYAIGRATRHGWAGEPFNWNIVCNAGMVLGALVTRDHDPDLSDYILKTALKSVQTGFTGYWPDGGWPEGPGYWSYATRYAAKLLDALDGLEIDDRGLSKRSGLRRSGDFILHCIGPTGLAFNFSDSEPKPSLMPMSWLGAHYGREMDNWISSQNGNGSRMALQLLWRENGGKGPTATTDKDGFFASVHAAFFRSQWNDPDALWVGFKGGDSRWHHAQLEIGTFVLDSDGARWAVDLGPSVYANPGYFNRETRWRYYRASTQGHNTLRIGGRQQDDTAIAPIVAFHSDEDHAYAVADLSTAYYLPLGHLHRGVALLEREAVLIQDEFRTPPCTEVVWSMHTPAQVSVEGNRASLWQDKRDEDEKADEAPPKIVHLTLEILEPKGAKFTQKEAKFAGQTEYPEPSINEGITKLKITFPFDSDQPLQRIVVLATPGEQPGKAPAIRSLDDWIAEADIKPRTSWERDSELHQIEGTEKA